MEIIRLSLIGLVMSAVSEISVYKIYGVKFCPQIFAPPGNDNNTHSSPTHTPLISRVNNPNLLVA